MTAPDRSSPRRGNPGGGLPSLEKRATSDRPPLVARLMLKAPGGQAMAHAGAKARTPLATVRASVIKMQKDGERVRTGAHPAQPQRGPEGGPRARAPGAEGNPRRDRGAGG